MVYFYSIGWKQLQIEQVFIYFPLQDHYLDIGRYWLQKVAHMQFHFLHVYILDPWSKPCTIYTCFFIESHLVIKTFSFFSMLVQTWHLITKNNPTSLTTRFSSLTFKYFSKMLDEKNYNSWHEEGFFDHSYY